MVGTRNSSGKLFAFNQIPDNVPAALRKLQAGGSGSRQTRGLAEWQKNEVTSNSQWNLPGTTDHYSPIHLRQPGIPFSECSHSADNSQAADSDLCKNVILSAPELHQMIFDTTCCVHCSKSTQAKTSKTSYNFVMIVVGDAEIYGIHLFAGKQLLGKLCSNLKE